MVPKCVEMGTRPKRIVRPGIDRDIKVHNQNAHHWELAKPKIHYSGWQTFHIHY